MRTKRVIYDFGANNGDDIPYYLLKSDLVVAVEANPVLAQEISRRFAEPLAAGKLILKACVLSANEAAAGAPFFIHKSNHVLSQFPRPGPEQMGQFEEVRLPSQNVVELIRQCGEPYYIKVDIEHYDAPILRALFDAEVRPSFISAESHSIEVFALLVALGGYESFNLVEGATVATTYQNHQIKGIAGVEMYSFPHHSAGPFGTDIVGPWMTADNFFRRLALEGLGWKDVHATREIPADPTAHVRIRDPLLGWLRKKNRMLGVTLVGRQLSLSTTAQVPKRRLT